MFQDVSFGIFQLNRNIALSPVYVILLNLLAEPKILAVFPLKVAIKR